jgi:hypothetical protein
MRPSIYSQHSRRAVYGSLLAVVVRGDTGRDAAHTPGGADTEKPRTCLLPRALAQAGEGGEGL